MKTRILSVVILNIISILALFVITGQATKAGNIRQSVSISNSSKSVHTSGEPRSLELNKATTFTSISTVYLPIVAKNYPLLFYQWLSQQQDNMTGLLPSQQDHSASTYNNALAVIAFTLRGDDAKAKMILEFFNNNANEFFNGRCNSFNSPCSQTDPCGEDDHCGFFQFRDSRTGEPDQAAEIDRWIGDNAWLLIAIHHYQTATGDESYASMAAAIVNLLKSFQQSDGYIASGWGWEEIIEGEPKQFVFRSTGHAEGNLDAYKALSLYGETVIAEQVKHWLDFTDLDWKDGPLDLHSWRVLSLGKEYGFSLPDTERTDDDTLRYKSTVDYNGSQVTGFLHLPASEYLAECQMSDNIWAEGTGQMAIAFYKAGYKAQGDFYVAELDKLLIEPVDFPGTQSIPFLALPDPACHSWVDVNKGHVAAVTWYIFAQERFDPYDGVAINSFQIANPMVKIEAENHDSKSDNVRYDNAGEVSEGNGIHIGGDNGIPNNDNGWAEYKFNTLVPTNTTMSIRYSDNVEGDTIGIYMDGMLITSFETVDTGTWNDYALTAPFPMGIINPGVHTLRLEIVDTGTYGLTIDYFRIDYD